MKSTFPNIAHVKQDAKLCTVSSGTVSWASGNASRKHNACSVLNVTAEIALSRSLLGGLQVLTWSGNSALDFVGGPSGLTLYAVFDSNGDTAGPLQSVNLNHDMFCPGISILPNGNVVVVAGHSGAGAGSTSFWTGSSFSAGPALNIPRGYNAAVLTTNGEVRPPLHVLACIVLASYWFVARKHSVRRMHRTLRLPCCLNAERRSVPSLACIVLASCWFVARKQRAQSMHINLHLLCSSLVSTRYLLQSLKLHSLVRQSGQALL
jgi:hypothetical protein